MAQIPKFNGEPEIFPKFIRMFNTYVHETNVNVQKKWEALNSLLGDKEQWKLNGLDYNDYQQVYNELVASYSQIDVIKQSVEKELAKIVPIKSENQVALLMNAVGKISALYSSLKAANSKDYLEGEFYRLILTKIPSSLTDKIFDVTGSNHKADIHFYCKKLRELVMKRAIFRETLPTKLLSNL
ncbi:hypothetical protein QR98_0082970 [Sarcoptes scabiei]|uniref:Uncharacterized protein n=1 Tax=Sarcoptes scabiei TaxID=52283 RepID=A0A132AFJ6_SARSC|nr:hypothetical protein QR98_0082970 [Sarcoptes scabiei]